MASPRVYVEPPTRQPRRGGIKTVAEFIETPRIGTGAGLEYTAAECGFPVDDVALCYPLGGPGQTEKTPGGISTLTGNGPVFGLYAGVECTLDSDNDFEARATEKLNYGEDRGIEKRLNDWANSVTASGTLSGGDVIEALARAEAKADEEYPGAPILLVNRGDAIRIGGLNFDRENGILRTKNGTLILSSSKFTPNSVTAVGAIAVHHTSVEVHRTVAPTNNTELAIAERVYAILVDCGYAARYTVSA